MALVDAFAIYGAAPRPLPDITSKSDKKAPEDEVDAATEATAPRLLFSYPPDAPTDLSALCPFCFPEDVVPRLVVRRRGGKKDAKGPSPWMVQSSAEVFLEQVDGDDEKGKSKKSRSRSRSRGKGEEKQRPFSWNVQEKDITVTEDEYLAHCKAVEGAKGGELTLQEAVARSHRRPENSAVFLVTGHTELQFGVVVFKERIIAETKSYFTVQPVAFVIVTTAPFLRFYRTVLLTLLDNPFITSVAGASPDIISRFVAEVSSIANTPLGGPLSPDAPCPSPATSPRLTGSDSVTFYAPSSEEEYIKTAKMLRDEGEASLNALKQSLLNIVQMWALSVPQKGEFTFYLAGKKPTDPPIAIRLHRPDCFFSGDADGYENDDSDEGDDFGPEAGGKSEKGEESSRMEESALLQIYTGDLIVRLFQTKTIFQLLTAILLEYKVIFVSPNRRLLTATILGFLPLIRPFEFQGSAIPILPRSLLPYLEAPIPLIVGVASESDLSFDRLNESGELYCVVNLHTGNIQTTKPLPAFPHLLEAAAAVDMFLDAKKVPRPKQDGIPYDEVKEELFEHILTDKELPFLSGAFQTGVSALVEDFPRLLVSEVRPDASTTTVFMRELFVPSKAPEDAPFFEAFLDTQMFQCYTDKEVRKVDRRKTKHLNSLRKESGKKTGSRPVRPVKVRPTKTSKN